MDAYQFYLSASEYPKSSLEKYVKFLTKIGLVSKDIDEVCSEEDVYQIY